MTEYVSYFERLRSTRDKLLADSDWAVMPDSPLSESKKAEWIAYRQGLRDVPKNNVPSSDDDPADWTDIVEGDGHTHESDWPTKPE